MIHQGGEHLSFYKPPVGIKGPLKLLQTAVSAWMK